MKKKETQKPFVSCIVAAAGKGSRMQAELNKIFLEFCDKPVLAHTLTVLEECPSIDEIVLVTGECDMLGCKDIAEEFVIKKLTAITLGGKLRQDSVRNALQEVSEKADIVLIHDAARPLVTAEVIQNVIDDVITCGAAAPGVPCKNTLKLTDAEGFIADTPDRSRLYEIQTPQGFSRNIITRAHENALQNGLSGTDDCFLVEQLGIKVIISEGDYRNIKITTPEDLLIAELLSTTL